jgi:hypothetical protein
MLYFIYIKVLLRYYGIKFATLESLYESFDINNAWEGIRENIMTSAKENLGYQLGRLRCRWEENIKMDLTEMGIDQVNWIQLAEDRVQWWAL